MKCPVCGKEMKIGEVINSRGERCFWAPKDFFNKHTINPNTHLKRPLKRKLVS